MLWRFFTLLPECVTWVGHSSAPWGRCAVEGWVWVASWVPLALTPAWPWMSLAWP